MKKITAVAMFCALFLAGSAVAQAQSSGDELNKVEEELRIEKQGIRDTVNDFRNTQKETRNQFQEEREGVKDTIRANTEAFKATAQIEKPSRDAVKAFREKQEATRDALRVKVESFRVTMEEQRNEFKQKVEEQRSALKERLVQVRDERKKETVERIYNQVNALNTKTTDHFSAVLDKLVSVLSRISNRADKGEANGLDVSLVRGAIANAETAIASAREIVLAQTQKVYSPEIVDEATLKTKVGEIRKSLHDDLVSVRESIVAARNAVHEAATALGKIPRIDEVEVEEATSTEAE